MKRLLHQILDFYFNPFFEKRDKQFQEDAYALLNSIQRSNRQTLNYINILQNLEKRKLEEKIECDFTPEQIKENILIYNYNFFLDYIKENKNTLSDIEFCKNELGIQKIRLKKAQRMMFGNECVFRIHFIKIIELHLLKLTRE